MKTIKFLKVTTVDVEAGEPQEKTFYPNDIIDIYSIEETPGRSYVDIWLEDDSCLLDVPKASFEEITLNCDRVDFLQ
jgi:hypothetical protein